MTIPIKIISKEDMNKIPEQEEVWDDISELWSDFRVKIIPIVAEFLEDKTGRIIDLGCGSGRNMVPNKDIEYYAVDFSSCQLANARMYAEDNSVNARFFKLKANRLSKKDFKDEMFDAGLFIATLHCIENEQERLNALKEFYRVLKKGAEGIITVWNSEDKRFEGKGKDVYMEWKVNGEPHMRYYYLYDKQELTDLLKSVGFKILEIYEPREKDRFSKKNWIFKVKK